MSFFWYCFRRCYQYNWALKHLQWCNQKSWIRTFYFAKHIPVLQLLCSEYYNKKCKLHLPIELAVQYYRQGIAACILFLYCLPDCLSLDAMQICRKICTQWQFVDTCPSWFVWGSLNLIYVISFLYSQPRMLFLIPHTLSRNCINVYILQQQDEGKWGLFSFVYV